MNLEDVLLIILKEVFFMKREELVSLIQYLQMVFDRVRLVEVSRTTQYVLNKAGELVQLPYKCYAVWNRQERCENCISAKAFAQKRRITKYEFVNNEIYYVVAKYIEVDEAPLVLEIISNVTDEVMLGAFGKEKIIKIIQSFNDKLYLDPLTGAYNRQYYLEQLHTLAGSVSLAMLDVDNFKYINDTFGHNAGDEVLKAIVSSIKQNIRKSDYIIRYGGDEFLIIMSDIPKEKFKKKLEQFRTNIYNISLQNFPNIRLSVSIGGCFADGQLKNAVKQADKQLYQAKLNKNQVSCDGNS